MQFQVAAFILQPSQNKQPLATQNGMTAGDITETTTPETTDSYQT